VCTLVDRQPTERLERFVSGSYDPLCLAGTIERESLDLLSGRRVNSGETCAIHFFSPCN
jgi:hypothetical protein